MAETKRIRLYYEGNDDRVVLEGLLAVGLLSPDWEIAQRGRDEHPGKDGLLRQVLPFVSPVNGVGGTAVVLIDLDDLTPAQRTDWFRKELVDRLKSANPPVSLDEKAGESGRVVLFTLSTADGRTGRAALVPVGLHEDAELRTNQGIDRFAVDDFVFRLVREPKVYSAVSELGSVAHDLAMKKVAEIAQVLRNNGIEIHHTKRLLHVLRAVAAVHPSSATFIQRLMSKAKETLSVDELRQIFTPLVSDLDEAAQLLPG